MSGADIAAAKEEAQTALSSASLAFLRARAQKRREQAQPGSTGTSVAEETVAALPASTVVRPARVAAAAAAATAAPPRAPVLPGQSVLTMPFKTPTGQAVPAAQLPYVPESGWLNMNTVEEDKLAWMKDLEPRLGEHDPDNPIKSRQVWAV